MRSQAWILGGFAVCLLASTGCSGSEGTRLSGSADSIPFYRLRFELTTTAESTRITIEQTDDFLTARLMATTGNPERHTLTLKYVTLVQQPGGGGAGVQVDYAVAPGALDHPIQCSFENASPGSSELRVLNLGGNLTETIAEIRHETEGDLGFALDLSLLKGNPPLNGERHAIQAQRMIWAFYYPWYVENRWDTSILLDQPLMGYYGSDETTVTARQIGQAMSAGIDGFISSWWGPGSYTDENLRTLLDVASRANFFAMINFELIAGIDEAGQAIPRSEDEIIQWLRYAMDQYGDHPAYMKVDGKPVVVMWSSDLVADATWAEIHSILDAQGYPLEIIGMYGGQWPDLNRLEVFGGMHIYNILGVVEGPSEVPTALAQTYLSYGRAVRHFPLLMDSPGHKIWTATVQPGYDDHLQGKPTPILDREGGALYRSTFEAALGSSPDWIFVTTWNEWWEHTYVEPSRLYGNQYLEITGEYDAKWE